MKRVLLWFVINTIVGTLVYALALYLTFPSDTARDRIVYEANKSGMKLQLVGVKPAWPWGFTLTGLDLYSIGDAPNPRKPPRGKRDKDASKTDSGENPTTTDTGEPIPVPNALEVPGEPGAVATTTPAEPEEAPLLSLDTLTVTSLLKTVMSQGKVVDGIEVSAELYGGTLTGSYGQEDDFNKVVLNAANIDLARYPFKGESFDVKASGTLGIQADLALHKDKVRESSGSFALLADTITLYKGSKIKGVDIPLDVTFAVSGGSWEVKNGRAEITELKLDSAPISMTITGSIMLNQSFMRSRANLKVAIKFGDELKMVAAFVPESAKSGDGAVHYILSGPLNNLRTRPDRLAARRTDRKPGGSDSFTPTAGGGSPDRAPMPRPPLPGMPGMNGGMPDPSEFNAPGIIRPPALDDEERERLREERRKRAEERRKRREELRQRRLEGGSVDVRPGFGDPNVYPGGSAAGAPIDDIGNDVPDMPIDNPMEEPPVEMPEE